MEAGENQIVRRLERYFLKLLSEAGYNVVEDRDSAKLDWTVNQYFLGASFEGKTEYKWPQLVFLSNDDAKKYAPAVESAAREIREDLKRFDLNLTYVQLGIGRYIDDGGDRQWAIDRVGPSSTQVFYEDGTPMTAYELVDLLATDRASWMF